MKALFLISLIVLTIFFSACSTCSNGAEFILLPEDGKVGKIVITEDGKEVVLDKAWQKVVSTNLNKKEKLSKELIDAKYNLLLESMPKKVKNYRLYFDFDSSNLTENSSEIFVEIVQELQSSDVLQVDIIGYTDRVGDEGYNKTLSMQRAKTVVKLLKSKGIHEKNMVLYYYGEANPLVKTADNVPNKKNRRVEITIK